MVYVGKTGNELRPVAAITAYLAIRGTTSDPFFLFEDGTPLARPHFVGQVHLVLCQAGYNPRLTRVTVLGPVLPPRQQSVV